MKSRLLFTGIAVVSFTLSGCGQSKHQHTWADKWSYNQTQHWVDATCGHNVCNFLGDHVDSNGDHYCDTCGYDLASGSHTHTFATEWSFSSTQHWHAATCGHDVVGSQGNHVDSNNDRICDICKYCFDGKVVSITVGGNISSYSYNYDDDWNLGGIFVQGKLQDGTVETLSKSDYTLKTIPAKPRNLISQLSVIATLKTDSSVSGTKTFRGINVEDEVYDEAAEINAYYNDCSLTYTGSSLMDELHRHSFAKHSYFVKYGETTSYLSKGKDAEAPDLIPGEHQTQQFYTANKTSYSVGSREHVWACNDSSGLWPHGTVDEYDYIGGGSDLYHIRPCNSMVNTARGDAPYVDFDHADFQRYKSSVVEIGDSGPYKLKIYGANEVSPGVYEYAHYVEPDDSFKGDIARIVAYLFMHYNTNSKTPSSYKYMTGGLVLNKVIGFSTVAKAKTILKEWNELDPVSEVEKRRNHTVQQIQGNRNPFVDYPELIDKVF